MLGDLRSDAQTALLFAACLRNDIIAALGIAAHERVMLYMPARMSPPCAHGALRSTMFASHHSPLSLGGLLSRRLPDHHRFCALILPSSLITRR